MSRSRTPLRYPGGKQRLAPFLLEVMELNDLVGGEYAEPYAGGAGAGIDLLIDGFVNRIHLNDSSIQIYAFWNAVLTQPEEFCRRISSASLTVEEWKRHREIVRHPESQDKFELGFSTFYLNRCNRSGVLSGGLIGGINQTGKWKMNARFSRNTLIHRIETIATRATSVTISNLDAEEFIANRILTLPVQPFVYCDPPYYEKGSELYLNHYAREDHARIAVTIQESLQSRWVVSYDNVPEIRQCYTDRQSFTYNLQYNARRVYLGSEVLTLDVN